MSYTKKIQCVRKRLTEKYSVGRGDTPQIVELYECANGLKNLKFKLKKKNESVRQEFTWKLHETWTKKNVIGVAKRARKTRQTAGRQGKERRRMLVEVRKRRRKTAWHAGRRAEQRVEEHSESLANESEARENRGKWRARWRDNRGNWRQTSKMEVSWWKKKNQKCREKWEKNMLALTLKYTRISFSSRLERFE